MKNPKILTKNCIWCGEDYQVRSSKQKFCTTKCSVLSRRKSCERRVCSFCGKPLTKKQLMLKCKCCSHGCAWSFRIKKKAKEQKVFQGFNFKTVNNSSYKKDKIIKICDRCEREYQTHYIYQKLCSRTCVNKSPNK